jgi:trimeric autotransporter adhesin
LFPIRIMKIRHFFLPLAAGLVITCAWGQQYTISTYAGNGAAGFAGDGGAPGSAQFSSPNGITFDSSGNLYIADSVNQRVREVSGGTINTIAGNGTQGYSGDMAKGVTGTATAAELFAPSAVAVSLAGNIFIADTGNHVIREVSGGIITTFAGDNTGGYSGDGGLAINAELEFPGSIAVDASGNVYIADSGNNVIREVSGGNINTILGAGFTSTFLNDPEGIVLDGKGNLYISDTDALRVLKFTLSTTTVTPIAGNGNYGFAGDFGPATDAELYDPISIALDSNGSLYIADTFNSRIRKVYTDGTIVTIAGATVDGNPVQGYGGDGGPATSATLSFPHGIAVDASGNVYISDTGNDVIRLLKPVTPAITTGGVVNAASYAAQVSPGALASIFGSNFVGTGQSGTASLPLPPSLGGVTVSVNGRQAPVLYVGSGQINFQIPWETAPGSATLTVSSGGIQTAAVKVSVVAAAPGVFYQGSHAIVQNSDYSLNSSSNPAAVGSTIIAYLTGAGAVSPPVADGQAAPSSPVSSVTSTVTATIGSQSATVSFAGLAPDFVGLWQANIVVPSGLSQGDYPLVITAGGQSSNAENVSVTP